MITEKQLTELRQKWQEAKRLYYAYPAESERSTPAQDAENRRLLLQFMLAETAYKNALEEFDKKSKGEPNEAA